MADARLRGLEQLFVQDGNPHLASLIRERRCLGIGIEDLLGPITEVGFAESFPDVAIAVWETGYLDMEEVLRTTTAAFLADAFDQGSIPAPLDVYLAAAAIRAHESLPELDALLRIPTVVRGYGLANIPSIPVRSRDLAMVLARKGPYERNMPTCLNSMGEAYLEEAMDQQSVPAEQRTTLVLPYNRSAAPTVVEGKENILHHELFRFLFRHTLNPFMDALYEGFPEHHTPQWLILFPSRGGQPYLPIIPLVRSFAVPVKLGAPDIVVDLSNHTTVSCQFRYPMMSRDDLPYVQPKEFV